jgi:hypothetical protein
MAKEEADNLIRRGKPALISSDEFRAKARAFINRINFTTELASLVPAPSSSQVESMLSSRPTFVRQLELIETSRDDNLRAVSDFLRASSDKTTWAEKGAIYETSLDELDNTLVARQAAIAGEITDLYGDKAPETRGRLVYNRCVQVSLPLEGRQVPGHFVPGCFNSLANLRRLGWHPDHASLLDKDPQ